MAKIVKVKIKKFRDKGTKFVWPESWDATKAHVLAYEETSKKGVVAEYAIAVIKDADWHIFEGDPDIELITEDTANELGKQWRPRNIKIMDQKAVVDALDAIKDEIRLNPRIPKSIKDILDPDESAKGINRGKEFDIKEFISQ